MRPDQQPRKKLRLPDHDYRSMNAYYITICTYKRQPFFEEPLLRSILEEQWNILPQQFTTIIPDIFVIMPDHVHGILWIDAKPVKGSPSLSKIIGAYKSKTCVLWLRERGYAKDGYIGSIWQRSYYDHIIRSEEDYEIKRNYILNNPIVAELKAQKEKQCRRSPHVGGDGNG
jgi:putative transposase